MVTMCLLLDMVACACQDQMHRIPTTDTSLLPKKTSVQMELELETTVSFTHLVFTRIIMGQSLSHYGSWYLL